MPKIIFQHTYNYIISLENLLGAWKEFVSGKRARKDTQEFERNLMTNIISLHRELAAKTYLHSKYHAFNISDPKPRNIHKATVRDRLLHHAIYRQLYSHFDKKFIFDSYSCRLGKGTHRALNRFRDFGKKVSKNNTKTCWVLKCDIRKFFASIGQQTLFNILKKHISDTDILQLISIVIQSFNSSEKGKGLPLGNLTSQLLVNIYMNEFDQWVKHVLKAKYYIRYADDFVILSTDKDYLLEVTPKIAEWLIENLELTLHPNKVYIKTLASGIDFLGWVHFPNHRVLRTATKRRMLRSLVLKKEISDKARFEASLSSYIGMLKHGTGYRLELEIREML